MDSDYFDDYFDESVEEHNREMSSTVIFFENELFGFIMMNPVICFRIFVSQIFFEKPSFLTYFLVT